MKLSFSTLACPAWTWSQAIDAARAYGYDGIEWRLIDGQPVTAQTSPDLCARIAEAMAGAGLATCALDSDLWLAMPPGPERDRRLEDGRAIIRLARAMGTDLVRMFPGTYPPTVSDAQAVAWAAESLRALLPEARAQGVRIALEVHDSFDWDRKAIRGTSASAYTADVARAAGAPEVGILWDLGNPYEEGETAPESWQFVRDNLFYVHTKDMRQKSGGKWEYVLVGSGVIPLPDVVRWLKAAGFDGWLSLEWEKKWHPDLAEPELALPPYVEYMQKLLRGA